MPHTMHSKREKKINIMTVIAVYSKTNIPLMICFMKRLKSLSLIRYLGYLGHQFSTFSPCDLLVFQGLRNDFAAQKKSNQ